MKVLARALSISVLNQLVSSGTNFLFGFYLIRVLTPTDFGLYGIGFAISLFFAGIGNALFLTQMVVYTPDKDPSGRLLYAAGIFILVVFFCIAVAFLVGVFFLITAGVFDDYRNLAFAISAVATSYLLKEFFVRHAYNVRREIWAFLIHAVLAGSLAFMVLMFLLIEIHVTVELAIYCYSLAHLAAVSIGLLITRLPLSSVKRKTIYEDFMECWIGGRWALITSIVHFLRTQAHTIVVTVSAGPVGVAYLSAARLLVTPAVMLTPALGQVFMPRLASTRAQRPEKVISMALIITSILFGVSLLYSTMLLLSIGYIAPLLLGASYAGTIYWLVVGWCFVSCLLAIRNGAEMTIQILKKFDMLMMANALSAIVALSCVFIFIHIFDLVGALIGLATGEVALIFMVWMLLLRVRKETIYP